jgi:hypothetical protein
MQHRHPGLRCLCDNARPAVCEVKASLIPDAGQGLFAVEPISQGQYICTYGGTLLTPDNFAHQIREGIISGDYSAKCGRNFVDAVSLHLSPSRGLTPTYCDAGTQPSQRPGSLYQRRAEC